MNKKELRARLKDIRSAIVPADEAERVRNNFLQNVKLPDGTKIATYVPTQSELNIDKLNRALGYAGYKLCLPVIQEDGSLIFREWNIYTELVQNKFGIFEPSPAGASVSPDIIIIPTLGFNKKKYRLGYGGGYYDRTLKYSKATRVAVAYAAQELKEDFQEQHDVPLDMVITEKNVII